MKYPLSNQILDSIEKVIGETSKEKPIGLHEPDFNSTNAYNYIKECIDSSWVSSSGKWLEMFETKLCEITKAKYAIAVTNGTVALRLALHLLGVKAGDEVLIPPLSFVASANAIAHLGAQPHFVDIEPTTMGLCPKALQKRLEDIAIWKNGNLINKNTGRNLSAIMAVHLFGNPADSPALKTIAREWNLPLVEDAAEALGSWREHNGEKIHCGLFGKIGVLSFNGNKLITTGGGGALLTNDELIAKKAKHLSTTAKTKHPWEFYHDEIGWNDRMPNLNAALGVSQLEVINEKLSKKKVLSKSYQKEFSFIPEIEMIVEPPNCQSNQWLQNIRFTQEDLDLVRIERNNLLKLSHEKGYMLRPIWHALHKLPMFSNSERGDLKIGENEVLRIISLPSSPQLLQNRKYLNIHNSQAQDT